ncbi:pyrroline-5-carboxylate reductase [Colwellia chukchiensis]|uniref:Pyrroline-5-carboxylate reductase n=1 Tax=Colwellia chukchiensis TaxID=641665 RepID=A0A1H7QPN5_9GAMM|nr:pyrroline-5-carboxylate reductase [Colwellia chukchiensis]SEL49883.1 pyrroline-5-carboxylate reductase [Colwellia chukchiensis]
MQDRPIAFIGGGNMAQAILTGLLAAKFAPSNMLVCAPTLATRKALTTKFSLNVSEGNCDAITFADVIFIAVKPKLVETVASELKQAMKLAEKQPLIISLAAGVTTAQLQKYFGDKSHVFAAMPNLPSAVGQGLTGVVAGKNCDTNSIRLVDELLSCCGKTLWLKDERQMPAIVASAGSAPAYFFLFLEAMIASAQKLGLSYQDAKTAALQSGMGALTMAAQSPLSVVELKEQVTSPNGTTHQALASFADNNLKLVVEQAMHAAAKKAASY